MDICDLLHKLSIGIPTNEVGFHHPQLRDQANSAWRKGPGSHLQAVAPITIVGVDHPMLESSFQVRDVNQ
jgi:hypothetical protein